MPPQVSSAVISSASPVQQMAGLSSGSGVQLLQQSDFTYLGAAKVPYNDSTVWFGTGNSRSTIAYDPADGNMFWICLNKPSAQGGVDTMCKLSIPTLVGGSNPNNLNTCSVVISGVTGLFVNDYNTVGWPHVYSGNVYWTTFKNYDTAADMTASHGYVDRALTTGHGLYAINTSTIYPGRVAGCMCNIPASYQTLYGGYPVLTGRTGGNIITTTSAGPSFHAFNPSQLNPGPAPCKVCCWYDPEVFDPHDADNGSYTSAAGRKWALVNYGGGLFFYSYGNKKGIGAVCTRASGIYWYGFEADCPPGSGICGGCAGDPAQPTPGCYPSATFPPGAIQDNYVVGKGPHGPPYKLSIYLYDPDTVLLAASPENGPQPAAIFDLPGDPWDNNLQIRGATFDDTNRRLYVTVLGIDTAGLEQQPGLLAWQLP